MLKRETSSDVLLPRFSVMDPELTETLPAYQTACGITDMLSHVLERYLTNTREVETSDRLLEGLMLAIIEEAPKVMADPHDYEARANLMWAACLAHNNMAGVGRSQDWASHDIEYALSSRFGCAHGAGLAIVMPAVMSYTCTHDLARLSQLAARVWGCEDAREGIARFRAFLASLGMPTTLAEIGAGPADIAAMAHETCCSGGRTGKVGGFVSLDEEDVRRILELSLR
jgi:alcohol dehydrogenase YqhD (iron-dependent ADH family)